VNLRVVEVATPAKPVAANVHLFTLPKEGQPSQWSVLVYMKLGQQNECISSTPTVFPPPTSDVILVQLSPAATRQ
jgi:hypothetical protein